MGVDLEDVTERIFAVTEVAHLLKAIEGKETAFPSFADGIKMERVFNSIDWSAKAGKWIDISDGPASLPATR
jgi:predicted dehydrogenase